MKKSILTLFLALSLISCGEAEKKEITNEKPVIKIGVLYPMTGNAAFFGDGAKKAAELYFDEFNKKNNKYSYELIYEDSQANPAKAVMAVRKLIDYDKVDIILDSFSSVGNAVSPITNEKKIPHLTFAQDRSISTGFYNYRVVTSTKKTGQKMVDALKQNNFKKVVGVTENTSGTLSLFNGFKDAAQQDKEVEIINVWDVNSNDRDFNILIQKIKSLNPDAIVVSLQAPIVDIFLKQAKNNQLNIPIVGIQSFSFLKDKSLAEGSWYVDVAFADKGFLAKHNQRYGSEVTNFAENFYTLLMVATHNFETISKTDLSKPTAEQFINNLDSVNGLVSPTGKLDLDRKEQNVDSEASVRLIQNGKIVEIKEQQ